MFRKISTLLFISVCFLLTSCVVSKKDSVETKEGLASLEKFETSNTILLIEKITSGPYIKIYNNRRMGDCKQFYKGQVEAVIYKDLDKDPKYADKKVYRYMLVDGTTSQQFHYMYSNGATETNTHVITNYFLFDRLTGKQFDLNVSGVNPDRVFKKAVQKMNAYMTGTK